MSAHIFNGLLAGDRFAFLNTVQQKNKVEDRQLVLKWAALDRGWHCDPGAIDNISGSKTQSAIESFKKSYNSEALGAALKLNRQADAEFWGAVFDLYELELAERMQLASLDALAGPRAKLQFFDGGRKAVGCGENWPLEARGIDGFRSSENRRVELLFFPPGHDPRMECHPAKSRCNAAVCEACNPAVFVPTIIPVEPVTPPGLVRIRLFDPFTHPIPRARFRVTVAGTQIEGNADDDAWVEFRVPDIPETCVIEWDEEQPRQYVVDDPNPPPGDLEECDPESYIDPAWVGPLGEAPEEEKDYAYNQEVFLRLNVEDEEAAFRRLTNLGFTFGETLADHIREFEKAYGRDAKGQLADVQPTLSDWHDTGQVSPCTAPKPPPA